RHGRIPPSLHFDKPNPNIDWSETSVEVVTGLRDWPRGESPRTAGVSSFGLSGTNAHVLIQEPPSQGAPAAESESGGRADRLVASAARANAKEAPRVENEPGGKADLLVISAAAEQALDALRARYAAALDVASEADFPGFCAAARNRTALPN